MEERKIALDVDVRSIHPAPYDLLLLLVYVPNLDATLHTRYREGNIVQSRISMEGATEMPTSWTRSHGSREETRKSVGLFSFFSTGNAICFFSRASWSSCDSVILLAPEGANIAFCVSTKEMSRIATVSREHEAYIGFSGSSWCSRFLRETS